jgi:hypothetical protein
MQVARRPARSISGWSTSDRSQTAINKNRPYPVAEAIDPSQLASALAYAHEVGMISSRRT